MTSKECLKKAEAELLRAEAAASKANVDNSNAHRNNAYAWLELAKYTTSS